MVSYFYRVDIFPDSGEKEASDNTDTSVQNCIYLSVSSSNKIYDSKDLRQACQLYLLNEVPNRKAIMPLDYKKLGKVSSSPLVKINLFLDTAVTDSPDTAATDVTLDQGTFSSVLPVIPSAAASSPIKQRKVQVFACKSGSDLFTICKNILGLKTLKIGLEDWKIRKVTAIDRMLVDLRN